MIHLCPKCGELTPGEWHDAPYWDCVNYNQDVTWAWCPKCREMATAAVRDAPKGLGPPGSGRTYNFQREVEVQRNCVHCGAAFKGGARRKKYCSEPCKTRAAYQRTKRWRVLHPTVPGRAGRPKRVGEAGGERREGKGSNFV